MYKPRQFIISKQRSESNNQYIRKSLLESEFSEPSPIKVDTEDNRLKNEFNDKVDNHVTKFSYATKAGKSLKNPRKKNQDQYIIEPIFLGMKDVHLFGIWDGHGVNGKLVSTLIKCEFPKILKSYIEGLYKINNTIIHLSSDQITLALHKTFEDVNNMLYSADFDIKFSGSTWVVCFFYKTKWFIANVGDSRAVLIKHNGGNMNKVIAEPLSIDHKPTLPAEKERILNYNGRVEPFKDALGRPKGPVRVWLKYEDIPGLAMSRSLGDAWGAMAGVISTPDIQEIQIDSIKDCFIVLGSDGVWEFLSNEEAGKILMPYHTQKNAEGAGEAIVKEAYLRWVDITDTMVDDITAVVTFLK